MSGDRYSQCPKCTARIFSEDNDKIEAVEAEYGKIPPKEFAIKMNDAQQTRSVSETLREDWEFVWNTGKSKLRIRYGCTCEDCGFTFSHDETVLVPTRPKDQPHV